jgi:hypothetical protein
MTMAQSLLEFILALLRDGDAKAAFAADPQKTLADAGLGGVCHEDVADAMSYIAEYHPVSFVGDHGHSGPANVPPPAPVDRPLHNAPPHGYGPEPHPSVVHQLEYITTNYSYINNHDTVIDKSVNQHIWNQGFLSQGFEDHSVTATDHSVAAGRTIDGNVASGSNNVVGQGNSVGNATHLDNHSVRGSFNGDNISDHAGVAGNGNADNVTAPYRSNAATSGSGLENSPRTAHDTAITGSFDDSHNRESHHVASFDSGNDNSYHSLNHESLNHQTFNHESFNSNFNNPDSYDRDSAITQTDQHGLINANLSPALPIPVHHNVLNLFSPHEPPLPG